MYTGEKKRGRVEEENTCSKFSKHRTVNEQYYFEGGKKIWKNTRTILGLVVRLCDLGLFYLIFVLSFFLFVI